MWKNLTGVAEYSIQGASVILNGVFNLLGKWIEAFGRACSNSTTVTVGIADESVTIPIGLITFLALNAVTIRYFLTIEPYASILKQLKLFNLLDVLSNPLDLLHSQQVTIPPVPKSEGAPPPTTVSGTSASGYASYDDAVRALHMAGIQHTGVTGKFDFEIEQGSDGRWYVVKTYEGPTHG